MPESVIIASEIASKFPIGKKDVVSSDTILDCLHHSTTSKLSAIKAPPKNKNRQKNVFCFPFIGFPHKIHNIRIEKQASIPS